MPIVISKELPAYPILKEERVFVMDSERAFTQDIRPIEIAILNLMPTKETTETQLLRLLGNTPLQVNVTFVKTKTYEATHTSHEHMERFYKSIDEISKMKFDGMIVTGAPVENMPFEQVKYWDELTKIIDFAERNVTSTVYICWGAQAALHYMYGIDKMDMGQKVFGVFPTHAVVHHEALFKGIDDIFYVPHSRHTQIDPVKTAECTRVLAVSDDAGIAIAKTPDNKSFFFMGHSEYDRHTLGNEYHRDLDKGLPISAPVGYYFDGTEDVNMRWRSSATLLFSNWLNYYVYQVTPY